jgi:hypothetical protein
VLLRIRTAPHCRRVSQVSSSIPAVYDPCVLTLPFVRWASQRMVFGKPLSAQSVIRAKLASMISRVEACQNWLETITYQMNHVGLHIVLRLVVSY